MEDSDVWPELAEMSRMLVELANAVAALLEAHETLAASQAHKLVAEARDLHHRIQSKEFTA